MFTSVSFEYMCLQPAVIGGLEGAEFAPEWFMVSVVGLHMTIQIVPESRNKGAILAAVLVLAGKHGQGQVAPLMRTQPLHGHQDSVTLTTMVSPRPGFILQHSIKQAVFTIHPVH